ncbi:MAG: hypothetical protein L6300_15450 [Syntrophaceae bacterium]|nr:hypothetical protein [Syntrophaceae bacterium]
MIRVFWMTVEEPLGRIIGMGFRKAVGVFFSGYLLPMGVVERDLYEGCVCNVKFLVYITDIFVKLW